MKSRLHSILLQIIEKRFPYFTKSPNVIAGYIYNLIKILEDRELLSSDIWHLIFVKLVEIDVNASRIAIENANEDAFEEMEVNNEISESDTINHHPQAAILDICICNLVHYINSKSKNEQDTIFDKFLQLFDSVILSSHNPYHIHFIMFYFSSLDVSLLNYLLRYKKYNLISFFVD